MQTELVRRPLTLGMLAGELSGDTLGAGLMRALRATVPDVRFLGVGGPAMEAAGLECLQPLGRFSINGFRDPIVRAPELWRLLTQLEGTLAAAGIDVFVGVDFNVFNLLLERRLRRRGFATVHYVSPSVYAWRRGRTRSMARSADLLLALYPFEAAFYAREPLHVAYVGHPLADELAPDSGAAKARKTARDSFGLGDGERCLALLPGSRPSELHYHLELFLKAAQCVERRLGTVRWLLPCPHPQLRPQLDAALRQFPGLSVLVDDATARRALTAADGAIIKSGTATLEAMLLRRPMVVAYRIGSFSYGVLRRLVYARYFALPNILADRLLVPEFLQDAATPDTLADALLRELENVREPNYFAPFDELHTQLRRDADHQAATAVLKLLRNRSS